MNQTGPYMTDWINVSAVVVLVIVTGWYAWRTHKLVETATKQTEGVLRQAAAVEKSLEVTLAELERQTGAAWTLAQNVVNEAREITNRWAGENIANLASKKAVPENLHAIPSNMALAVERSRFLDRDLSVALAKLASLLRQLESEAGVLRKLQGRPSHEIKRQAQRMESIVTESIDQVMETQQCLSRLHGLTLSNSGSV